MSRGLGNRQRLILAAMNQLEADEAEHEPGDWFCVWAIINTAGKLGLDDEIAGRKAREDAEWAEYEAAQRQRRLEVEALAAAGDVDAKAEFDRLRYLDAMTDFLKSALRRRRKDWRGAPQMRDNAATEDIANPSRVLALLQQRGLIERDAIRGPGASARLTDAGRIMAQGMLEAMEQA